MRETNRVIWPPDLFIKFDSAEALDAEGLESGKKYIAANGGDMPLLAGFYGVKDDMHILIGLHAPLIGEVSHSDTSIPVVKLSIKIVGGSAEGK